MAVAGVAAAFGAGISRVRPLLGQTHRAPISSGLATTVQAGNPVLPAVASAPSPVLQVSQAAPPPVLAQPASAPPTPALSVISNVAPPVTEVKASQPAGMPADVRNWLEHLAAIERARGDLASQQAGRAAALLADLQANGGGHNMAGLAGGDEDAIPTERSRRTGEARGFTDDLKAPWRALESRFASVPPPAECASMAKTYTDALEETGAMMAEISAALTKANSDPEGALQTLYAMQGRSKVRIDRPLENVDGDVADLCGRYGVRKWFDVGEGGSSGVLAKF